MKLYKGECLEVMKSIPDASIDAIITDPPYGTTACKWDSVIDFELMWGQLNRIIKPNGAIVLFGSEPFSSTLRVSNIKNYKYDWIWEKDKAGNFALANRMPMKYHEIISVFYKKQPTYNKQRIERSEGGKKRNKTSKNFNNNNVTSIINGNLSSKSLGEVFYPKLKNPSSVLKYNKQVGLHPTQKPIALMEYLIKTYTNENETVLDFTMGSGSTGVACVNTNRKFIGIEMDDKYFEIAEQRIKEAEYKLF
jgi:site-specific DNA-methyltransferase (adenine-specific)